VPEVGCSPVAARRPPFGTRNPRLRNLRDDCQGPSRFPRRRTHGWTAEDDGASGARDDVNGISLNDAADGSCYQWPQGFGDAESRTHPSQ
jgi:hypothetical protein